MLIKGIGTTDPLEITVMPHSFENHHIGNLKSAKVAIVLAKNPLELNDGGLRSLIISLYGLTATETVIAILLCRGKSVDAIAEKRQRSVYTIRSQIKVILKKIGSNRQSEIITRMLNGLGPIVS